MPARSAGLLIVERVVCVACRVGLPGTLSYGLVPRRSIHGNGGPSSTVFVGEVDQQCVAVVLDAQAMPRIRLLVQTLDNLSADAFVRLVSHPTPRRLHHLDHPHRAPLPLPTTTDRPRTTPHTQTRWTPALLIARRVWLLWPLDILKRVKLEHT
jgi:hypothetical protein